MNTTDPIASLLFGRVRLAVLCTLLEDPGRNFFMRELASRIEMVPGAIQRELKLLVEAGLITRSQRGRQVYFQANVDCIVFSEVTNLLSKTAGIAGVVRRAIAPLSSKIRYAAIYGSLATGKLTPRSDIDLLIVGDISIEDVIAALHDVEELVGREINPSIYSQEEFELQLREPDSFLSTVWQTTRLSLIGNIRGSRSLGAARLDSPSHTEPKADSKAPRKGGKKPPAR